MTVLFFVRGRGHGHALRDLALSKRIESCATNASLIFVSYATGAKTLKRVGHPVIDLDLPEDNGYSATLRKSHELIGATNPDVVLVHEEIAAVSACNLLGVPCLYMSSWLPPPGSMPADSLCGADSLVIFSDPGIFPILSGLKSPPKFVGPLVRDLQYTESDRESCRIKLGLSNEMFVVTVVPGGWSTEMGSPLAPVLFPAFQRGIAALQRLFWASERDFSTFNQADLETKGIFVLPFYDPLEELILASDVIITKGNRGVTMEAAELGIPSISVSFGSNRIDTILTSRVASNISLSAQAIGPNDLGHYLTAIHEKSLPVCFPLKGTASKRKHIITQVLLAEITRLAGSDR
jgi:hypothetical protein